MRWPWVRRREPVCPPPSDDTTEAARARAAAEQALRRAREQTGEVSRVASQSRQYRRVNHFAELIAETFRSAR